MYDSITECLKCTIHVQNKNYKDTLGKSSNDKGKSKTDAQGYGQYYETGQKVRQRRLCGTLETSTSWNGHTWCHWIHNPVYIRRYQFRT